MIVSSILVLNKLFLLSTSMEQPSIYLGQLLVEQPVTLITNVIISVYCFYLFGKLKPYKSKGSKYTLWRTYFFLMAWSTLLGGFITHGFMYAFEDVWKLPGWYCSMIAISALGLINIGTVRLCWGSTGKNVLLILLLVELIAMLYLTAVNLKFTFVGIHSGIGMLIFVLGLSIYAYYQKQDRSLHKHLMMAVLSSALASLVFAAKLGIGPWFNHVDMSHVFLYLGNYFLFRAAIESLGSYTSK